MKKARISQIFGFFAVLLGVAFVFSGIAYGDEETGDGLSPDTMQAVSPNMARGFQNITGLLSGGIGAGAANTSSANTNASANMQANITETDTMHKQTDVVRMVGGELAMTSSSGSTAELMIQTNQAEQELAAAADDLAHALVYAAIQKYINLSHEQAVALWIDEGIRYGIIIPPPDYAENKDPLKAFSLIPKAFAQSGGSGGTLDGCFAVPFTGTGQQGSLQGMQNDGSYSGRQSGAAARSVQCAYWGQVEGPLVANTQPNPQCSGNNTIDCDNAIAQAATSFIGPAGKSYNVASAIAHNSVTGGSSSSDNSDHSSFFISSAYASTGGQARASGVPLSGAISNLGQKTKGFCSKAQQSKTDDAAGCGNTASNETSHVWAMGSESCAYGVSPNHVGNQLSSSADRAGSTADNIRRGEIACQKKFERSTVF